MVDYLLPGEPVMSEICPTNDVQPLSPFFKDAYACGPASRTPFGPAYDSGWVECGPSGGRLNEVPVGGGGWNKFPCNDKLPAFLNNVELVGPGACPRNEYIGYAGGGVQDVIAKSRSGGYLTGINRPVEAVPIARSFRGSSK